MASSHIYCSYHGSTKSWNDKPRYTIDYAAPEMLQKKEYGEYSEMLDVWCLGATLYTMFMGHSPFRQGREDHLVSHEVLKHRILYNEIYTESLRWQQASEELQNLIQGCLEKDINKRFTLEQILQHTWFESAFKRKSLITASTFLQATAGADPCNVIWTDIGTHSSDNKMDTCLQIEENLFEDLDIIDLRKKSLQSEGDVTSGLGQSKSSDEISIRGTEIDDALLIDNTIQRLTTTDPGNDVETNLNPTRPDYEEFKGFDENSAAIHNWLLDNKRSKFVIFDKIRQIAGQKPLNRTNEVRSKQKAAALPQLRRRSARNLTSVSKICKPLAANSKTKSTSKCEPTLSVKRQSAIKLSQSIVKQLLSEEFYGFDDQERKRLASKAKSSWRLFCTIIYHTQMSLKHFNFDRRVYNRVVEDNNAHKEEDLQTVTLRTSKSSKDVTLASRRQPSRLARAQRARYVFE